MNRPLDSTVRKLFSHIEDELNAIGVVSRRLGQSFRWRSPTGVNALHVSVIRHPTDLDLTVDVAVRIDALEELMLRHLPSSSNPSKFFSFGAELGAISGQGQLRWTIAELEACAAVARDMVSRFRDIGVQYLTKLGDPETAFLLLRGNARETWVHSPVHLSRLLRVIGLAHLLHRQAEIDELSRHYSEFLRGKGDDGHRIISDFALRLTKDGD